MKSSTCCDVPYKPTWEETPPHSGEWVFQSKCPACGKVTDCQPGGADMQELHNILKSRPPAPATEPTAQGLAADQEAAEARDSELAMNLMKDLLWWHRQADRTAEQVNAALELSIQQCQDQMTHPKTRAQAIHGFQMMLNRLSEFTVEPDED